MSEQLSIHDQSDDTYSRFIRFHEKNPHVYERFKQLALQAIRSGKTKLGARQIIEVIRWEKWLRTEGDEQYKINNDYIAYYARQFVAEYPQHRDKFELRTLKRKS